jgi:lipoprotein signal peptidase
MTKFFFFQTAHELYLGPLTLKGFMNHGVILGHMADVDPLLRIIFFSTFFTLILFVGLLIKFYFLNSTKFKGLDLGLTLFLSGISGNAFDRIRYGGAVDFINVNIFSANHYFFNLADVVQLTGFALIVFYLFKLNTDLFREDTQRKFSLIDPTYQLSFAFKFSLIAFFASLMTGTFAYVFVKVYVQAPIAGLFMTIWSVICALLIVLTFFIGLILSKRNIGPIFAFKRYVQEIKLGKSSDFKLREQDSFKQLEEIAKDIHELCRK